MRARASRIQYGSDVFDLPVDTVISSVATATATAPIHHIGCVW
jgi:hypothetical protein